MTGILRYVNYFKRTWKYTLDLKDINSFLRLKTGKIKMNFLLISFLIIVRADLLRDSTLEGNSFIDFIDKMSEKDLAELLMPSKYGIFHRRLFENI